MDGDLNRPRDDRPDAAAIQRSAELCLQRILAFVLNYEGRLPAFEPALFKCLLELGRLLMHLFLVVRNDRLHVAADDSYRVGNPQAERTLKTLFGTVLYVRTLMVRRKKGGNGYHPLDVALGLTRDRISPWVIPFVTRLATKMSYASARRLCRSIFGWSPSTEGIEDLTLGLGSQAAEFVRCQPAPPGDGEVLVIEVDGKCPPTARESELKKRRGPRSKHPKACVCGCQRHRGQAKRARRGSKARRKKGDKSKNGKEVVLVVMYTMKRGTDGKLHGPLNKKVWGSFAGRKKAAAWARAEATKRGFGPDTTKTIQVVIDGASGLRNNLQAHFPKAIITVDVRHVEEKLWALGHKFHPEGSAELKALVGKWKKVLYEGRAMELVELFRERLEAVPVNGPGTKGKRMMLAQVIRYIEPRVEMMKYAEWRAEDLVIASGQVEGAVRHVVGERLDCAGMRWVRGRAEPVLQLRCIEINGDWDAFIAWADEQRQVKLCGRAKVQIRTKTQQECTFGLAV